MKLCIVIHRGPKNGFRSGATAKSPMSTMAAIVKINSSKFCLYLWSTAFVKVHVKYTFTLLLVGVYFSEF